MTKGKGKVITVNRKARHDYLLKKHMKRASY